MVFCNMFTPDFWETENKVTILILIDGFLQSRSDFINEQLCMSQSLF